MLRVLGASFQRALSLALDVAAAARVPTETVRRPDPGIARGVWEAPGWAFWVVTAAALVGAGVYAAARAGAFRRFRRGGDG